MRLISTVLLTALPIAALPYTASADDQQGFYLGAGAAVVSFSEDATGGVSMGDENYRALELLGGYKYNAALGAEARIGTGMTGRTFQIGATEGEAATQENDADIDQYAAIYYRPELSNPEAKLYALIGYAQIDSSVSSTNLADDTVTEADASESGLSYGIGVGFVINPDFNINFEARRLIDTSDLKVEGGSIYFDYRF